MRVIPGRIGGVVGRGPFVRRVRVLMAERDIDNPTDLYEIMKAKTEFPYARSTVYGYLSGDHTPQPAFVTALIEALELDEEEAANLGAVYRENYYPEF